MGVELAFVALELVDDHPKNPRIIRQKIVEGIAANLNGEYPKQHAMEVVLDVDRYRLISGHHRKRAAIKAGLDYVWVWVREIPEDEQAVAMFAANEQSEVDPVEWGLSLADEVEDGSGDGKTKGGVGEYAESHGVSHRTIQRCRHAGQVLGVAGGHTLNGVGSNPHELLLADSDSGRSSAVRHLAQIHRLPAGCWPEAVEILISWRRTGNNKTEGDIKVRVDRALAIQGVIEDEPEDLTKSRIEAFLSDIEKPSPTREQLRKKIGECFEKTIRALDDFNRTEPLQSSKSNSSNKTLYDKYFKQMVGMDAAGFKVK